MEIKCKPVYKYGFNLDFYDVLKDSVKEGDTFGEILNKYNVPFSRVNEIATSVKDSFDIRNIRANKEYTILSTKDSLKQAKVFVYKKNEIESKIIDFTDSIPKAYTYKLPVKTIERHVSGTIETNFSQALDTIGVRPSLAYRAADIYAATIDFFRLQKGDKFKLIFEENFIHDTISVGYGKIKAMVFNHRGEDLYAYRFVTDSIKKTYGFFDEKGRMLQRQFLKSPIKFQYRISSRFNLRRRIALYGNKVRAHRGTDFAAPYGTPIMSTANGTVIESTRRGGNGNFVKIRHDNTYMTQYLHMKKRNVKVGDYVKQGDIIGWVGLTGNTSGPHVCYRFWKNGVQVDPLRQRMPTAKPMPKKLINSYLEHIKPFKSKLDKIK